MNVTTHPLTLLLLVWLTAGAPTPTNSGTRVSAQTEAMRGAPQMLDEATAAEIDVADPGAAGVRHENFRFSERIDVYGLRADEYTTTIEGTSGLTVSGKNIGQIIIYARLISTADTSIFIDNPALKGDITFTPVAAGRELEEMRADYTFSATDEYRQIYYLTQMTDVEEVTLKFTARNGIFLLERLKVIPYSAYGISTIQNRERYDNQMLSVPQRREQLYNDYVTELTRVEEYHKVLHELIARRESANLASLKTRGYNPFSTPEFQTYFNKLIAGANQRELERVRTVRSDIATFNFRDIALSVDNLLLGGKFSTLVDLVDKIFVNNITLTDDRNRPLRVVQLNGTDYAADERSSKLILKPLKEVADPTTLRAVQGMKMENQQYQAYVQTLQQFLGEDLDTQNKINQEMEVAKSLRGELERLTWEILNSYTERPRADFIDGNNINYILVSSEFTNRFPAAQGANLEFLDRQELKLLIARNNLRDIRTRYQELLGNLQTHYSTLYSKTPQKRITAFQQLDRLPPSVSGDWATNQLEIATAYQDSALKGVLDKALTAL